MRILDSREPTKSATTTFITVDKWLSTAGYYQGCQQLPPAKRTGEWRAGKYESKSNKSVNYSASYAMLFSFSVTLYGDAS